VSGQPFRDHAGRYLVAITGIGVKTPAGCDVKSFTDTIMAGTATAAPVTRFDTTGLPSAIACHVPDFDLAPYGSPRTIRRLARFTVLGLAAAMDAVTDAGRPAAGPGRTGIFTGTCLGGMESLTAQTRGAAARGPGAVSPLTASMFMFSAPGAAISMELGWTGPNLTVTTACASGTDAIGLAARQIQGGELDLALAGGTDAGGITQEMMASFGAAGALSCRNEDPAAACRPFDPGRDGYVMGEGAAYLVLERLDRAQARGATLYGQVAGYGTGCDAHHMTAPYPGGQRASRVMQEAIADAGLETAAIRQVNCHATSTVAGDAAEAAALRSVFGDAQPPVTASKGVLGHLTGAAGAAEAAVATLSAGLGLVPPTAGHCRLAEDCAGIDVVTGSPRRTGSGPVLSSSFGMGGQDASIVILPAPQDAR
jgi:3-oxoacyl-[acyl-carrier-protein] synthase II